MSSQPSPNRRNVPTNLSPTKSPQSTSLNGEKSPTSPYYNLKQEPKLILASEYLNSQDYQEELTSPHDEAQCTEDPFGDEMEDPFGEEMEDPFEGTEDPFGVPKDPFDDDYEDDDRLEGEDYPEDQQEDNGNFDESFEGYEGDEPPSIDRKFFGSPLSNSQLYSPSFRSRNSLRMSGFYEPLLATPSSADSQQHVSTKTLLPDIERQELFTSLMPSLNVALFIILLLLAVVFYSQELQFFLQPILKFFIKLLSRLPILKDKLWSGIDESEL